MNKLFAVICLSLALLSGCRQENEVLPKQREQIVSFLTKTHSPPLIAESQIEVEGPKPYYSTIGSAVYRYIENAFSPDRETRTEVVRGSKVTITFRAYIFAYKSITDDTMPYYTNDKLLEQAMYKAGLTPGAWPFEPLTIHLGHQEIIKGLETALLGCREGDTVEAYMTYNMAYGDINFSIIPRESPVAYFFTVDKVE